MLHYARLTNQSSRAGCHLTITNSYTRTYSIEGEKKADSDGTFLRWHKRRAFGVGGGGGGGGVGGGSINERCVERVDK